MFTKIERVNPVKLLTLQEAKDQLNIIDFDDDDNHIRTLIESATEICEEITGKFFSKTLVKCRFTCLKTYLPYLPYIEVISVKVDDVDVEYTIDDFSNIIEITDNTVTNGDAVTVEYYAGYEQKKIPKLFKQACKIMISDFYDNRGSLVDGKMVEVPVSALMLLKGVRNNKV